jgi:hypothetical protein
LRERWAVGGALSKCSWSGWLGFGGIVGRGFGFGLVSECEVARPMSAPPTTEERGDVGGEECAPEESGPWDLLEPTGGESG